MVRKQRGIKMQDLCYFEKIAEMAIFSAEEKKIIEVIGNDSRIIRMNLSKKQNFTDSTLIAGFESRE